MCIPLVGTFAHMPVRREGQEAPWKVIGSSFAMLLKTVFNAISTNWLIGVWPSTSSSWVLSWNSRSLWCTFRDSIPTLRKLQNVVRCHIGMAQNCPFYRANGVMCQRLERFGGAKSVSGILVPIRWYVPLKGVLTTRWFCVSRSFFIFVPVYLYIRLLSSF